MNDGMKKKEIINKLKQINLAGPDMYVMDCSIHPAELRLSPGGELAGEAAG